MPFIHRRRSTKCLLVAFLTGCGGTNTTTTPPDSATLIAINPSDFPAIAACGKATAASANGGETSGPVTAYVAELIDLSWSASTGTDLATSLNEHTDEGFVVQASPATPCTKSIVFGQVSPFREYKVRVTTYVDPGGDPNRTGICTRNDTSVAVVNSQANCSDSSTPATSIASFECFGWLLTSDAVSQGGGAATTEGGSAAAGSPSALYIGGAAAGGLSGTNPAPTRSLGRPAMAIEYRTVTLPYCM